MKKTIFGGLLLIGIMPLCGQGWAASDQDPVFDASSGLDEVSAIKTVQTGRPIADLLAAITPVAAQYQKDLGMMTQVAQWRTSGNPNNPTAFSLAGFQADLTQVNGYLTQAQQGLTQIANVPVEFAGALVVEVPGPQVNVTNPTKAQTLQILTDRRTYWQGQLTTFQGKLNAVNQLLDPSHVLIDEFGIPHGFNQSTQNMATLHPGSPATGSKLDAQSDLRRLDAIAAKLNASTGSRIPLLSDLPLTDLQAAIKTYGEALKAVKFPPASPAQMDLITAAELAPTAAQAIINWSLDQATVDDFNAAKAPGGALIAAQSGLTRVVNMLHSILNDMDADVAFVDTGAGGGQAVIDRKIALLQNQVIPTLTQAQEMFGTLISYQRSSIAQVSGPNGRYSALFAAEQDLLTRTQNLYNQTLPWSLASFGGTYGDVPGSLASLAAWKQSLNQYADGIARYQQDVKDRQCASGCTRTEFLYGETQPFSLPAKIAQYGSETAARAQEINAHHATINQLLTKIQTLSDGRYDLRPYLLPTGIGADAASAARLQAVVGAGTILNLGVQLRAIGAAARAAGGNEAVPAGIQPSPAVSNNQQIALLAQAAAERLMPSADKRAPAGSASEAVARYLFSFGVVSSAQDALTNEVPRAAAFLQQTSKALGDAVAQAAQDAAYVNSNGASETPDAVYARKSALFQELDGLMKRSEAFNQVQLYYNTLQVYFSRRLDRSL